MTQQGDIKLFQTDDDGEISVAGGVVAMNGGLETMAYLCLFGGNQDDDGADGNPRTWWGNLAENETERHYRSETQYLLRSIPATSANLRRIEDAVRRDLKSFLTAGIATEIEVSVTVPELNRVKINIDINQENFEFVENWRANS